MDKYTQIQQWQDEGVYPDFGDLDIVTRLAERQAFDIVALAAAPYINESSRRSRKLTLNVIKAALESGPTSLQHVLLTVLELPPEKVEELRQLLDRTTLARVIEASTRVGERLDFLSGLGELVSDPQWKRRTLERRQLHRILANETWIFGEEWALTGNDQSLTRVLAEHRHLLGDNVEFSDQDPVRREDGRVGIPDLVLSRARPNAKNEYEYLIVELKRPSHRLTTADVEQLRSYADAVADEDRFRQPNARWTYLLVGNSATSGVDRHRDVPYHPYGWVETTRDYSIWVRTWAEIIGDAKHQLKHVQDTLNLTTTQDLGVEYLRLRHHECLPEAMLAGASLPGYAESGAFPAMCARKAPLGRSLAQEPGVGVVESTMPCGP
jgi:hypothetical protein